MLAIPRYDLNVSPETTPIFFAPSNITLPGEPIFSILSDYYEMYHNRDRLDLMATKILNYKALDAFPDRIREFTELFGLSYKEREMNHYLANVTSLYGIKAVPLSEASSVTRFEEASSVTLVNSDEFDLVFGPEFGTLKDSEKIEEAEDYLRNIEREKSLPKLVARRMISDFIMGDIRQPGSRSGVLQKREILHPNRLDLFNSESFFSWTTSELTRRALLEKIPFQLKSILAAYVLSTFEDPEAGVLKNNLPTLLTKILDGKRVTVNYALNYLHLQGVEMLTSYRANRSSTGILIKESRWTPATLQGLRAPSRRGTRVLCRLNRYEGYSGSGWSMPHVAPGEGLDLPSYDEYFFVIVPE